jgi:putative hydrolase of the HAD superfamily
VVSAVIFDLDDTLIIEEATARHSLLHAAQLVSGHDPAPIAELVLDTATEIWRSSPYHPLCLELGITSWEGLWATFDGCHSSLDGLRAWAPDYRARAWSSALETIGIGDDALANEMSTRFIAAQRRGHPVIAGASATVRSFHRRWPLGMLTNGPPDIQRLKLAMTGLADCFTAIVISGEIGVGKPDPRAFAIVADRLGIAPADIVMVGDNWERDVMGAIKVGMSAVWISAGRTVPAKVAGVSAIERVDELSDVLG